MKHTAVRSSNIASIGYDIATQELEVTFKNGSTYVYEGVPSELHAMLLIAPSVGKHLDQHVKGKFNYRKKG